jgi:tryptophan 2,3-dioxygenase
MKDRRNDHLQGLKPYGSDELTYETYLKIRDILGLQIPQSDPPHHDEMLFIVIHQTYELWFKLILHELEKTKRLIEEKNVLSANHFLKRVVEIFRLLVPQIHILETMTPQDFLEFRNRLGPASGFQSLQFREVEFIAGLKDERYFHFLKSISDAETRLRKRMEEPDLPTVYLQMLKAQGFKLPDNVTRAHLVENEADMEVVVQALLPIYKKPYDNLQLYILTESLVDFDQYLGLWRDHHVRMVERIIGAKMGTGGSSGQNYLRSTTSKQCFPFLWKVRSSL